LHAYIEACLSPEGLRANDSRAWLAYWSQVHSSEGIARIQRIYQRRFDSNLRAVLRPLVPAAALADHAANWKAFGAVLVVPDGHTLRNEEFAVKVPLDEDSFMWVESVAHAEAQTDYHEPGNRSLLIQ
jgi:hypothetical protein